MTDEDIETSVKALLSDLSENETGMNATDRLKDDLRLNSVDLMELVVALEEEFSIEISRDQTGSVVTVADVQGLVERLVRGDS